MNQQHGFSLTKADLATTIMECGQTKEANADNPILHHSLKIQPATWWHLTSMDIFCHGGERYSLKRIDIYS